MGLKSWLIGKLIGKEISKFRGVKLDDRAELLLKLQQEKFNRTLRDAEKINKANILRMNERSLRDELKQSLDDEEEEEEEEEEEGNLEKTIEEKFTDILLKKFLGGVDSPVVPSVSGSPNPEAIEQQALASGVTPAQIKLFKEKMGLV